MKTQTNLPNSIWKNPIHFIAFGFGSGAFPFMPGTIGTVMGLLLYIIFFQAMPSWLFSIVLLLSAALGWYVCDKTSHDLKIHDHPGIVWDEIFAIWLVLFFTPKTILWQLSAFALFRFFDIIKPWPIRQVDAKVEGGLGIMLDDVLAAVYSVILIALLTWML